MIIRVTGRDTGDAVEWLRHYWLGASVFHTITAAELMLSVPDGDGPHVRTCLGNLGYTVDVRVGPASSSAIVPTGTGGAMRPAASTFGVYPLQRNTSAPARSFAIVPAGGGVIPLVTAPFAVHPLQRNTSAPAPTLQSGIVSQVCANNPTRFKWQKYGGQYATIHRVKTSWSKTKKKRGETLYRSMYGGTDRIRRERSFVKERKKQILRWLATFLLNKYKGTEIQCYYVAGEGAVASVIISSNKDKVNKTMASAIAHRTLLKPFKGGSKRVRRHTTKLLDRKAYPDQKDTKTAILNYEMTVPAAPVPAYTVDLHAERRIRDHVGEQLDPSSLGGVKRPCLVCACALGLDESRAGPMWPSKAGRGGWTQTEVEKHAEQHGLLTHMTEDKYSGKLTTGHDTDSESDVEDTVMGGATNMAE